MCNDLTAYAVILSNDVWKCLICYCHVQPQETVIVEHAWCYSCKSNAAGYLWWFNAVKRVWSVGFQSEPHLWPEVSVNRAGSPVAWASFRTQVLTSGVLACLLQGKMYQISPISSIELGQGSWWKDQSWNRVVIKALFVISSTKSTPLITYK